MTTDKQQLLRAIPKVDECLAWFADSSANPAIEAAPLVLIKRAIREILEQRRNAILTQTLKGEDELSRPVLRAAISARIQELTRPRFQRLINATGVVVHTNMGRSLLPETAVNNLKMVGARYANLEFDLATGKRGSRYSLVEEILCDLTGAEAAMVVNNNAAAVFISLSVLAKDREVIVSRGQLVEIGGSFRIPDIMARSGARLVEVGATNRTHLRDYENAIRQDTALLLKVHTSNYRLIGFTSEVPVAELTRLGAKYDLPVMEDLGSGCLIDLSRFGLPKEPTVGEVLAGGVDVVTFSGDKLLGGPQAGLILGKKAVIDKIKSDPLNRALRIDKFTLAGLESILRLYYDEERAVREIPTLAMLSAAPTTIKKRAQRLQRRLQTKLAAYAELTLLATESRVGGGSLPEHGLPSYALTIRPLKMTVNALEKSLRSLDTPVIGRIEDEHFLLDLRTVADAEVPILADSIIQGFGNQGTGVRGHESGIRSQGT
jgi:L-seryl-tRNA(Ser) seleniumtransferase